MGDLEQIFIFPYIGNVTIPTDELIFFRGVGQPPTRIGPYGKLSVNEGLDCLRYENHRTLAGGLSRHVWWQRMVIHG